MKVVTGISVSNASTSATFNYTAPDTRACDVDTSPDGTAWTWLVDAGGSSFRVTTVTGLVAGTLYYRILCYFSQTSPLFSGSQITDGILTSGTPPTITSTSPLPAGSVAIPYSYQFTATGTAPISWAGSGLPSWASLGSMGLLTGTPNIGGTSTFNISATNAGGIAGPLSFSLSVNSLTCDVNHDGVVNILDVQIQTNMALGTIACTNNLSQSGQCNNTDVQRVITAAQGGACRIGP